MKLAKKILDAKWHGTEWGYTKYSLARLNFVATPPGRVYGGKLVGFMEVNFNIHHETMNIMFVILLH